MFFIIFICENHFFVENTNFLQGMGSTTSYNIKTRGFFYCFGTTMRKQRPR